MKNELYTLIDKLENEQSLTVGEYQKLIDNYDADLASYTAEKARFACETHYGKDIYILCLI